MTDERRLAGPAQVPAHEPLLDADGIERLREAMRASRYNWLHVTGDQVAAWFDRQDALRGGDLLSRRYRTAAGLRLHQEATIGADGWAVDRQLIALPHGLRWTEEVDPLVLTLVGGCDGNLSLRDQLTVLAAAHDVTEDVLQ